MDAHLKGQESASKSSKGSGSTDHQGDGICVMDPETSKRGDHLLAGLASNVDMRTELSEMTDVELGVDNFASSARAGRRNALPDIQGSAGTGGTSELPLKLETLSKKKDVKKKDEGKTQDQTEKPPNEGK